MPLLRNGRPAKDVWAHVEDGDSLPSGPATVTLDRWKGERALLLERNAPLGLRLLPEDDPAEVRRDLGRFELICLAFPAFTDGRAYSQARLLRERFGYTGELRAVGNVLRDQFLFMLRCGFDAVQTSKDADAAAWQRAVGEIGVAYQPTGDRQPTAAMFRRGASSVHPA